jgi:hypothetical protein
MRLLGTFVETAIGASAAATAAASFLVSLHLARRSDSNAARDEALALAETRRQVILDLRRQVASLERQLATARLEDERRATDLAKLEWMLARLCELLEGEQPAA